MRPFKFFFMIPLALLFFFFIGRFLFFAFMLAAMFSLVFFIGRKAMSVLHYREEKPVWKNDLLMEYPSPFKESLRAERIIEVK
ncbi:MAG: hypothetical protein IPJ40_13135 [Saprospirales bacterium]|nr:hypothetical protein [Saprospirales bacterium]